ncbi:MAG: substrate-binding domain-containing protein [Actinobacteria bacterium]|nr:substrate-binding domain-containing protein [Actinomycetota bacterium]
MQSKQVDGYIIIPTSSKNRKHYMTMQNENVVFFDRYSNVDDEVCIKVDNIKGSMVGVNYLINLGHKNIGIINIPMAITTGIERFEGYKRALTENNIVINPELIKYADYSIESSFQKTKELMNIKNKPTAIFSTGILVSVGVLKYLRESEIKIPEDISFIGFDELEDYSELLRFKPTVIKPPIENLAILSVETLLKKINKKNIDRTKLILEPELIIRDSCKKIIKF